MNKFLLIIRKYIYTKCWFTFRVFYTGVISGKYTSNNTFVVCLWFAFQINNIKRWNGYYTGVNQLNTIVQILAGLVIGNGHWKIANYHGNVNVNVRSHEWMEAAKWRKESHYQMMIEIDLYIYIYIYKLNNNWKKSFKFLFLTCGVYNHGVYIGNDVWRRRRTNISCQLVSEINCNLRSLLYIIFQNFV